MRGLLNDNVSNDKLEVESNCPDAFDIPREQRCYLSPDIFYLSRTSREMRRGSPEDLNNRSLIEFALGLFRRLRPPLTTAIIPPSGTQVIEPTRKVLLAADKTG